ncbi:tetracycline-efflux transporter [Tieghemostelium lacteum]|uniref:Tetracycline-efflux transporter n=1 Tax=Tieghemostelium lacteum TaxID=361077 RepID=A0A151Z7P1_TIELA|nr:tetracycline-efflux transporter [Tieghemostelium lacteum]|eukprot:KYQ89804.1 tetracycline-efflux transporter [Tieghemostelium lacteum]
MVTKDIVLSDHDRLQLKIITQWLGIRIELDARELSCYINDILKILPDGVTHLYLPKYLGAPNQLLDHFTNLKKCTISIFKASRRLPDRMDEYQQRGVEFKVIHYKTNIAIRYRRDFVKLPLHTFSLWQSPKTYIESLSYSISTPIKICKLILKNHKITLKSFYALVGRLTVTTYLEIHNLTFSGYMSNSFDEIFTMISNQAKLCETLKDLHFKLPTLSMTSNVLSSLLPKFENVVNMTLLFSSDNEDPNNMFSLNNAFEFKISKDKILSTSTDCSILNSFYSRTVFNIHLSSSVLPYEDVEQSNFLQYVYEFTVNLDNSPLDVNRVAHTNEIISKNLPNLTNFRLYDNNEKDLYIEVNAKTKEGIIKDAFNSITKYIDTLSINNHLVSLQFSSVVTCELVVLLTRTPIKLQSIRVSVLKPSTRWIAKPHKEEHYSTEIKRLLRLNNSLTDLSIDLMISPLKSNSNYVFSILKYNRSLIRIKIIPQYYSEYIKLSSYESILKSNSIISTIIIEPDSIINNLLNQYLINYEEI